MKAKIEFKPISITLEDEDEVRAMWHRLNLPEAVVQKQSDEDDVPFPSEDFDVFYMFDIFDSLVNQKE